MKGQPAKVLGGPEVGLALAAGLRRRKPTRSKVIILLSVKAGLRACEISRLTWAMVGDARGQVGPILELPAKAAKKGSGEGSRSTPTSEPPWSTSVRASPSLPRSAGGSIGAGWADDGQSDRRLVR